MRDPRAGLPWSRARVVRRVAYAEWMGSRDWLRWREQWWAQWVERHDSEPVCAVCDTPWTLRHGDLHHRSYDRLGHEHPSDVVALCRPCHHRLHRVLESGAWRCTTRAQATDLIIRTLRRLKEDSERTTDD
jgi:ribosomal protein L37AE/L43A